MERDKEGFFYPVAEEAACINCDRCNRVCPAQKPLPVDDKEPSVTPPFLGKTDSGHKAPPVACSPFGGESVGAGRRSLRCGNGAGSDGAPSAHNAYRGSAPSDGQQICAKPDGDCFTRVRLDLEHGRKVLFSGTGCQVQGLLGYLGGPKPGLLTVDVICHGVPSEAVWQAYAKAIGAQLPLSFRDKCTGWQQYSVQLNGTAHPYRQDPYMQLFLSDVILRPSCYHCPAKVQAVCRI